MKDEKGSKPGRNWKDVAVGYKDEEQARDFFNLLDGKSSVTTVPFGALKAV